MFENPNADHEITRSEGNHTMPQMHAHDYYELYYLEAGSREYFVEDTIFSVAAGDFVLIAPGKLHRTGGEYGMRTLVCFKASFLLRTFSPGAVEKLTACFDRLKITPSAERREMLAGQLALLGQEQDDSAFAVRLGYLLLELGSCAQTELAGDPVSAMVSYINANFASITNIQQIADQFYISKFHLCRVFKAAMKLTVIDYLNQVRVRNACRYLVASDKDVGEIALLCGFHDAAYFGNVFKRLTGITPGTYRRQNKG